MALTYSIAQDPDIDLILLPENLERGDIDLDTTHDGLSDSDAESLDNDATSIDISTFEGIHLDETSATAHPPPDAPDNAARKPHTAKPSTQSGVRFKVSSAILRETSPVFRELLNNHIGTPGAETAPRGAPRIPICDDDPVAMGLVLRKIHGVETYEGIQKNFPLTDNDVDLACLADIAIIVEKYRIHSHVEQGLKECIDRLWEEFGESSVDDALAWTWISWAFDLTDHFTEATLRLAQTADKSLGRREALLYPLPRQILGQCSIHSMIIILG
ncbi:hypothetical protein LZ31DRAFT_236007 [Colletotrichum somersetense]|nr:hypothetical protein LZ31DRAFT_236007 [Colletotrichum somersetense]